MRAATTKTPDIVPPTTAPTLTPLEVGPAVGSGDIVDVVETIEAVKAVDVIDVADVADASVDVEAELDVSGITQLSTLK